MDSWWTQSKTKDTEPELKAVAYYRHSSDLGQENSVEIQQDNVRAFAAKHNINIIKEYADRGKSGLTAEGRPAFNDMMGEVHARDDFDMVLALDITRWGRFQDTDLSAHYESLCTQNNKQVVYTHIGFTGEDDKLITQLRKSIDRYQSAEYSRSLSKKVFQGAAKVAKQGYRPGASPPYGFHRLMLDENKQPDRVLQPGQRKAIQNGRVILVPGDANQVETVMEIFVLFVEKSFTERQIAGHLNAKSIPSPGGVSWSVSSIRNILTNQQYAGAVVYNRTSQRLKTPCRKNPRNKWIVTPDSFEAIVDNDLYEKAQAVFVQRKQRYKPDNMLQRIRMIYEKYNVVTSSLLQFDKSSPSAHTFSKTFRGCGGAFQAMFSDVIQKATGEVVDSIRNETDAVEVYDDFIVINKAFSVLIQPSVPAPHGYGTFWSFRPDHRPVVDITLGVPLSDTTHHEILGYLAVPRLMVPNRPVRVSAASEARIDLHGHNGLDFIKELLQ